MATPSTPSDVQPTDFGTPFDDEDADIIVRSSDLVDFRAYRLFLVKASPIFKTILSPGTPSHPIENRTLPPSIKLEQKNGLVVLCLPELREVVLALLSVILSITLRSSPSIPNTLDGVIHLLVTAEKYQVHPVIIHLHNLHQFETENPFYVFCLAWKHGLRQAALTAARCIIAKPLTIEALGEDLRFATGPSLYELVQCRERSVKAICQGLGRFRVSEPLQAWLRSNCATCHFTNGTTKWLEAFLKSGEEDVATVNQMQLYHEFRHHVERQPDWDDCRRIPIVQVRRVWTILETEISRSLAEVQDMLIFGDDRSNTPKLTGAPLGAHQPGKFIPDQGDEDVVLRSSDLVDYRVHKTVLAIFSPFFREMFRLPQHGADPASVDVIHMSEDSQTLNGLISAIYPIPFTKPTSVDSAISILAAFQKYEMDTLSAVIRSRLYSQPNPLINADNAFRVYALATMHRLAEDASLAARCTLGGPMTFAFYGADMRVLPTGGALYELRQYRTRCRQAATDAMDGVFASCERSSWPRTHVIAGRGSGWSSQLEGCNSGMRSITTRSTQPMLPEWLALHLEGIAYRIQADILPPSTLLALDCSSFNSALMSHVSATHCNNCPKAYVEEGNKLWNALAEMMDKAVQEVTFNLPW